jgi:hypothetical protein
MTGEWRPIETAPQDGTWVMVYSPSFVGPFIGRPIRPADPADPKTIWESYWGGDCWARGSNYSFTHWMPLPLPPRIPDEPDRDGDAGRKREK